MSAIFSYTTGKYQVSAISDGTMQASLSLLTDIHHDDAVELQRQAGIAQPGDIHVFCYLIRGQGRVILVDTGMGKRDAQSGKLLPHLQLAGVTPDDIDTLLLTHAHPDHIGGLLDSAVSRSFAMPGSASATAKPPSGRMMRRSAS